MAFDMDKWIAEKTNGEVLIEHIGDFSSADIDSIIPDMEKQLSSKVSKENVRRKAFCIFVECIQNLYHHVESDKQVGTLFGNDRLGFLFLTKEKDGQCRITTGNFIHGEKTAELRKRIDYLNSLSQDQLKELYRSSVNANEFSNKGGAGLGMIDIARKSGNKLICQFYSVKEIPDLKFFSFDVTIGQKTT